ncbi:PREDICTED: sugar transporter SWEET1 [Nicrophorus vespilloides]|uniref:Sugar transporter SWEET1 n=1 Tax=Nicrophorus vespilloides TaxID=110193 RepID=A0ABM1MUU5_NICVS|nr:PREDICTED: sugar transporter SWEET1 [Nicrophorus vespilloides]
MEALSNLLQPYKEEVGVTASVVTILQFFSGTFICYDIYKRKSTNGIGALPFIGGVVIGILVLKFSMILQDKNMFNVNVAAILLNTIYLAFYIFYSKNKMEEVFRPCLKGSALIVVLLSYVAYEDPNNLEYRYGLIVTVLMLLLMGSPLIEIKSMIKNEDASAIPFPLTLMGTIVSFLWLLYGIILLNSFMVVQNILGFLLCVVQLALSIMYPLKVKFE